jgi:hypothetical protein
LSHPHIDRGQKAEERNCGCSAQLRSAVSWVPLLYWQQTPRGSRGNGPRSPCLAFTHGDAEHLAVAKGVVALGLPRSGCRSPPRRPAKPPSCSAPDGRGGRWRRGRRTGSGRGPTAGPGIFHLHTCAPGRCGLPPIWRCRLRRPAPPPRRRPCGWRCHLCRPPSPRRREPCRPGVEARANLEGSCPASVTPTEKPCGYGIANLMSPTWVVSSR